VPDVSPLRNVKFRVPLTFTAAKVFVNIFSRKYYFTNNLEITLAGAKFWTLCCVVLACLLQLALAYYTQNQDLLMQEINLRKKSI